MFTEKSGKPIHNHRYDVDGNGTGETIDTLGASVHVHEIKDWVVQPGGEDEHTHEIPDENKDRNAVVVDETKKDEPETGYQDREPIKPKPDKKDKDPEAAIKVTIEVPVGKVSDK